MAYDRDDDDDDDYDHDGDGPRDRAIAVLPPDHQLGIRVRKGGSMCARCEYLASRTQCGNDGFIKWNGDDKLPAPADEYCCDLYENRE